MIETHRRGFLIGLTAILAAPAIVSYSNIMPVSAKIFQVPLKYYAKQGMNGQLELTVVRDGFANWHGGELIEEKIAKKILNPAIIDDFYIDNLINRSSTTMAMPEWLKLSDMREPIAYKSPYKISPKPLLWS